MPIRYLLDRPLDTEHEEPIVTNKKKTEERVLGPGAYGEIGEDVPAVDVESYVLGEDGLSHPASTVDEHGKVKD